MKSHANQVAPNPAQKPARLARMTVLAGLMMSAASTGFADPKRCTQSNLVPIPPECARPNRDVTVVMPVEPNQDAIEAAPGAGFAQTGFSISLEDETIAGAAAPRNPDRVNDRALSRAAIDVTYDGLQVVPRLNVSTGDLRASYPAGAAVTFRASTNYPAWIARAEVRVTELVKGHTGTVTKMDITPNGSVNWQMPSAGSGDFTYVVRVYDAQGRYNETVALPLSRSGAAFATELTAPTTIIAAGEAEDRTAVSQIPISGGSITASGMSVGTGTTVQVMGETVVVDATGNFVIQRILPTGGHVVDVTVARAGRTVERVARSIDIPASEWFYVAIADVTLGRRLQAANPADLGTYADGRAAFYLKGKVKGQYLITSSLDTGEGDLSEMFSRLDAKDPRHVLRRLDPDDYYPVYGDDSTAYDDTPTSGTFYLRVERDQSTAVWGDFKAGIDGASLLRNDRSLYGAKLHFETPGVTTRGDAKGSATIYAATPDTLPQRDVMTGTGGSTYLLSRHDINGGSETVVVEVVDPVTGRIISRRTLVAGQDYSVDYLQGVILLNQPLSSSAATGGVVSNGASGGNQVRLVAQYEYTPALGTLSGAAVGGQAQYWVNDALRIGLTSMRETTGVADQQMNGFDLKYRFGEKSSITAEVAQSEGPGFGRSQSSDGGLSFGAGGSAGVLGTRASAYRVTADFDLADLGLAQTGNFGVYAGRKDAGFSTLSEDVAVAETLNGFYGRIEVTDRLSLGTKAERFERKGLETRSEASLELGYKLSELWRIDAGLTFADRFKLATPAETGTRTDLGARLTWQKSDDLSAYVFGQATVSKTGGLSNNNRLGVGGKARLSEKVTFGAEVSGGNGGTGAKAVLSYAPSADTEVHLGYTLDPTRTGAGYALNGRDEGTLVLGGRHKITDTLSAYGENKADLFGQRRSFTETYGVSYTPSERWTYAGSTEMGQVIDAVNGNFTRNGVSAGVTYTNADDWKWRARFEYRDERGAGLAQDRQTFGLAGGFEYKVSEDWRMLGNLDALKSNSDQSVFRDGEFLEASLGYAYRPIADERTNALVKLSYLRDLPGADQLSADGSANGPLQKSLMFSIDVNHDLGRHLTLGGKYGFRQSQIASRNGAVLFNANTAHLAVLRADWHVVHLWDVMVEGRMLFTEQTGGHDSGILAGVYRHLGDNAKIGVGYEWGNVSDDLSAIDYQAQGIFLNLIAKY
ncbi:MAG: hypothetical protein ACEQSU_02605 [Microgenomates group bacterium]